MSVVNLKTIPRQNAEEAAECLRNLAALAEKGEVIAVTGIAENSTGGYFQFGSSTMSRLQTAGALLEAAVKRLGFGEVEP